MARQSTLVIIKPDAVYMGMDLAIQDVYLQAGLDIVLDIDITFSREQAAAFYQEHQDKFYFAGTVLFMSSGPSRVLILEGDDAIEKVRTLNGATDPNKAEPGTIRYKFRSAGGPANTVHASDSPESYQREFALISEIQYRDLNWPQ